MESKGELIMAKANVSSKYQVNVNENNDRSPIRKADGTKIMKITCPVCNVKYGYNELDGDPGCQQCDVNRAIAEEKLNRLAKLEAEAEAAEKDAEEFAKKEKALKDRIAKAKGKK
jgi:hypothetical protein